MFTLPTLIQHSFGIPRHSNKRSRKKKTKGIQIGKEEVKLSLFADDNDLIPKKLNQNTLRYHKHVQQITGYKIIIQKSVAFPYTNNEQTKKEIWKTIPFTMTSKRTERHGSSSRVPALQAQSRVQPQNHLHTNSSQKSI
jgi:hypothetical protein